MALDTPENREKLIDSFHHLSDDENFLYPEVLAKDQGTVL